MRTNATTIGPWTLLERIAMGGTSEVFLAEGDEGTVALKVPRNPRGRDQLLHEADALRKLDHPGIPKVLAAEPRGGWLALEYIPGMALTDWAAERPLEEVVQVLLRLLTIIGHLHESRLVHGDLTPGNVLVRKSGDPVLIDLGLAAGMDETVPFGFRGTLGYAAPELLKGGIPTEAADLYGFGAVAYAALTGRPPFRPQDPAALAYVPLVTVPLPPSSWRPRLAGPIDDVLLDLLARDATLRPEEIRTISTRLWEGSDTAASTPVLGMLEVRDRLRRIALEAVSGDTRIVVLYGPPGCGRQTLAREIVGVATREGAIAVEPDQLAGEVTATEGEPLVCYASVDAVRAEHLCKTALDSDRPVLLLLRAARPIPDIRTHGAFEITPPPLGRAESVRLAVAWGAPDDLAERWWRDSFGHPASVHAHLRAWLRTQGRQIGDDHLDEVCKRILDLLHDSDSKPLAELALALRMGEHRLLDHCEVLFAEGRVESANDGAELRLTRQP